MDEIAFPIYVLAKDDDSVIAFQTVAEMQGYLEAIDVENGEYETWDSVGRCLSLAVKESKREWLNIIQTDRLADKRQFAAIRDKAKQCPK
jgi:hypothetical protein